MQTVTGREPVPGEIRRPLRVLVVEDESILAEDLRQTLVADGYEVTAIAPTGERAIASARNDPPDIILMDIRLAGPMDGIDTAADILKFRSVPVIYLTAYADPELMDRAKRTRPYGYLLKPYDMLELHTAIEIAFYRHASDLALECAYADLDRRVKERTRELAVANEGLQTANKKLALLNNITRHDILNQVFSLKAFLTIVKEKLGNTEIAEYLGKAEQAATAIERQIAFTREYQDLGVGAPVWQNIGNCVKNVVSALPLRDVQVLMETGGLEVLADPLLEKVFYNLIDNALRYGGPDMTRIRVFFQKSGTDITIVVDDDGTGITAEDKVRLFTRGFGKHTGLGLFLSREILAITGITIIETGEPGKGARFDIVVPEGKYRIT